jgi:geranylgeranyl reductase family protein
MNAILINEPASKERRMTESYDTIIIGGGPAGGSAAFFLGQAGQRVLVLEKENLLRYKPCGGGLSEAVLHQFPFSFEPVIERRVKAVRYVLEDQSVTIPLPGYSMCMVMRDRFDAYLLQHARAELRPGTQVDAVEEQPDKVLVETESGKSFACRQLIAADGANSRVARCLGLRRNRTLAAAIEVEAHVPPDILRQYSEMPMLVFGKVTHGYVWIFPKSDHLSIGIGGLRPGPGELQATLRQTIARFGISLDGAAIHGHPVPIFRRWERLTSARTLLVGDAAGLVDPFTGEGIRFALDSGRLAAEAILGGHPEKYPLQVNRRIRSNHAIGAVLANSFFAFPNPWFALVVRNPYATHAFVDMMSGRAGYSEVALRLVGTIPLYLFQKWLKKLPARPGSG